jgi:hypothetical protein
MKFILTIDGDSADLAEGGRDTLANMLCQVANQVCETSRNADFLQDHNGNTVGNWVYEENEEDGAS